jgi:ribulose-5-phosphate 4-epimerase/fuculose-1-phosphate aldolase
MAESEGVILYKLDYRPGSLPPGLGLSSLLLWFGRCRALGLIGQDTDRYEGFAYGNISIRADPGFVISGTQTGGNADLSSQDLAWVQDFDPGQNRLTATGPARPSSEAMTHGQIYRAASAVNAVIHAHSDVIWRQARGLGLALTSPEVGYGTPEMAAEVEHLLASASVEAGAFAMGGHEDGVVAYAADMDSAGRLMLDLLSRASAPAVR